MTNNEVLKALKDGKKCIEQLTEERRILRESLKWALLALDTLHGRTDNNGVTYAYAAEEEYQKARKLLKG